MLETVACYGCEGWTTKGKETNNPLAVDMD